MTACRLAALACAALLPAAGALATDPEPGIDGLRTIEITTSGALPAWALGLLNSRLPGFESSSS